MKKLSYVIGESVLMFCGACLFARWLNFTIGDFGPVTNVLIHGMVGIIGLCCISLILLGCLFLVCLGLKRFKTTTGGVPGFWLGFRTADLSNSVDWQLKKGDYWVTDKWSGKPIEAWPVGQYKNHIVIEPTFAIRDDTRH